VSWTFDYLQALAVLTGLIAVAGLFLYLAARQRSTLISYVLLRRIGITRRTHFGSLGNELAGVLTVGWGLGVATALVTMLAVFQLLDVNPNYPPGGLLIIPIALLGASLLLLIGVVPRLRQRPTHRRLRRTSRPPARRTSIAVRAGRFRRVHRR
jgi:putative ABC transport system permease protein